MRKYDLITPEGTKDFLFEECYVRREIEQNLHDLFQAKAIRNLLHRGWNFSMCSSQNPVTIRRTTV